MGADRVSRTLASNRLGVPAVVFFVLSAATPLTVVAGVVTTGFAVTGVIGLPIAFVAIAALLALFSVGYVAMSRHITNAGAFYTYVTHGLGRPAGVAAAYMALLAYNLLQVGLYGIIGVAAAPQLEEWFGITLDWWVIALIAWAIVGFLGLLRIDVNGTVLAVLLLTEMAIIIIYSIASLANPADGEVTFDTLQVGNLFESGVGAILVLAVLGFVGFEASVVYSEESRDPKRTIALATYISIAVVAAVYVLASWAMSVATGPDNIVAFAQQNADQTIFVLADSFLGSTWVDIGSALFITSVLAAMISFHNTVARYVFALGRERVLPSALGRTSPSSGAPVAASIVQSVVGLVVILVYVLFDLDPLVQLFFYLGTTGGFGVLTLVTLTSVAVLAFFARHPSGENPWRRIVAPTLATVLLVIVVVLAIANYDILIGVAPDAPERWILPGLFLVAALIGLLWALFLKSSRPEVYDAIGRGANAATGISVLDLSTEEEPGQPSLR
ncbi:APC family permease [Jiangella aurantiaca]|uniref:APC family permease n=1 Tax=Jiangella aurantiaca TaxID=2530373 RepID=UPI003B82EBF5